jgi:hypothetical protein
MYIDQLKNFRKLIKVNTPLDIKVTIYYNVDLMPKIGLLAVARRT